MPGYEIHVTKGPKAGKVVPLTTGRPITIGRAPTNDLSLEDAAVSSFHARVELMTSGPVLTDLKSKNGTFVNGTAIIGSMNVQVGQEIGLGSSALVVKGDPVPPLTPPPGPLPAAAASRPASAPPAPPPAAPPPRIGARPSGPIPSVSIRLPTPSGSLRILTPSGILSPVKGGSGVAITEGGGAPIFSSIDTNKSMAIDPKMLKSALAKFGKAEKNLATLHAVGNVLASAHDPDVFFPKLLDHIFDVVSADRGAIFVKEGDSLVPKVARSGEGRQENITISQTILHRTVEEGVAVLTSDAAADDRFKAGASVILQQIRSAMCVPVRGRSEVFGAIYVDSKIARGAFKEEDLELLTTIAVQAGISLENSRLAIDAARAERMAAIGLVVSGLAHDIKNYMQALKGGDYILDTFIKAMPSPEAKDAWATMQKTLKSISDLVMDMLAYSKPREPEWTNADVNQICGEALSVCKDRATARGVTTDGELDFAIGPFYFDPKGIGRCLMNLVANAIDASTENQSKKVVVFSRVDADDPETVCFGVRDQGHGIQPEHRDRIFDLLFSTKGSKGTGIGLAVTRKIVEEHGGSIAFESEVEVGTTFYIRLPRRRTRPARTGAPASSGAR